MRRVVIGAGVAALVSAAGAAVVLRDPGAIDGIWRSAERILPAADKLPSPGLLQADFDKPAAAPRVATAEPSVSDALRPSFDVVLLKPKGGGVIAGRAVAGARVTVEDEGGTVLGTTTADPNGEWVIVPDRPLAPGLHRLSLSATAPGASAPTPAEATVALMVPEPAERVADPGRGGSSVPPSSLAVLIPEDGRKAARPLHFDPSLTVVAPPASVRDSGAGIPG
jgi:hypothetical protein